VLKIAERGEEGKRGMEEKNEGEEGVLSWPNKMIG
jgi:hypothetical protein